MMRYLSKLFGDNSPRWLKHTARYEAVATRKCYFHSANRNCQAKCPDAQPYRMRLALPPDYKNVLNFVCNTYYKHDPAIVSMGLSTVELPSPVVKYMYEEVKEGMTIIAQDRYNCIIGAAVNTRSCPWDSDKALEYARCCDVGQFRDVFEFFAYITRKPNLWERYCVLSIFECSTLAVDPEFQGLSIAKKLVEESWYLARDCGYRLFRIDCTSRYTANIAEDFGWQLISTVPFCRYVKDGKLVFKNIKEPHTEVQTYIDRLKYCKTYSLPVKKRHEEASLSKKSKKKY